MAIITSGKIFSNGEQLTAEKMNQMFTSASFDAAGAIDSGSMQVLTDGSISVKDAGITPTKLSAGGPSWTSDGKTTNISGDGTDAYLELNGGTGSTTGIAAIDFHSTNATNPDYDGSIRHFQGNFVHQTTSSSGQFNFFSSADATPDVTPTGIVQAGAFRSGQGVPGSADASTTGFAFGPDGDTGMFGTRTTGAAAGGDIAFFMNGAQRVTFDNTGDVKAAQITIDNGSADGGHLRLLSEGNNTVYLDNVSGFRVVNEGTSTLLFQISLTGQITIPNIATSASGLSSGNIYSDSGTLKIVS